MNILEKSRRLYLFHIHEVAHNEIERKKNISIGLIKVPRNIYGEHCELYYALGSDPHILPS